MSDSERFPTASTIASSSSGPRPASVSNSARASDSDPMRRWRRASCRSVDRRSAALVVRVGRALSGEVLAVQGPPGSGKTHTGAALIRALLDDLGMIDLDFATTPELAPAVRSAVDSYLNGHGH